MGVACMVLLIALQMLKTRYGNGPKWWNKAIWFLSTGRLIY